MQISQFYGSNRMRLTSSVRTCSAILARSVYNECEFIWTGEHQPVNRIAQHMRPNLNKKPNFIWFSCKTELVNNANLSSICAALPCLASSVRKSLVLCDVRIIVFLTRFNKFNPIEQLRQRHFLAGWLARSHTFNTLISFYMTFSATTIIHTNSTPATASMHDSLWWAFFIFPFRLPMSYKT